MKFFWYNYTIYTFVLSLFKRKIEYYNCFFIVAQDLQAQEDVFIKFSNKKVKNGNCIFIKEQIYLWIEKIKLEKILAKLTENNFLLVTKLSRLGRSVLNLLKIVNLCKEKKAKLIYLK